MFCLVCHIILFFAFFVSLFVSFRSSSRDLDRVSPLVKKKKVWHYEKIQGLWEFVITLFAEKIIPEVLKNKLPENICLNVNIPKLPVDNIKGIKYCRQAKANWEEEFDERKDPSGKDYYWLTGVFKNYDDGTDTDIWALENGYVSIVPVQTDMTAHNFIETLQNMDL